MDGFIAAAGAVIALSAVVGIFLLIRSRRTPSVATVPSIRASITSLSALPEIPSVMPPEADEPEETQMGTLPSLARMEDPPEDDDFDVPTAPSLQFEVADELEDPTGPNALILVTAIARTDRGKVRKNNEDSLLALEAHHLFVVADGMGGYAGGEIASKIAVDTISESFLSGHFPGLRKRTPYRRANELVRTIEMANDAILRDAIANTEHADMGTTVVAARFSPGRRRVYVANVGDSRAYRIRGGAMEQLTTDHTLELELGLKGRLGEKLSRAVGVKPKVKVDVRIEDAEPGDYYLMCSDGLSKMVAEDAVRDTVLKLPLEPAAKRLVAMANELGGRDNISVILIRVDEATSAFSRPN
jgi:protein phosphatase